MNNHHEYTIFDETSEWFEREGWSVDRMAGLVAVGAPFEVLMTAYGKNQKVLQQTTIPVTGVRDVLQTWMDEDAFLKIERIAYKISPHYLNRWVDVSDCYRKSIPNGVKFLWQVQGYSIAKKLEFELPENKQWGPHMESPGFGVTSIFIPEDDGCFYPLAFTPAWAVDPEKADPKSSSQTFSANRKAEVQSDICPECGNHDGEHSSGCPVVASTEAANAWAAAMEKSEQFATVFSASKTKASDEWEWCSPGVGGRWVNHAWRLCTDHMPEAVAARNLEGIKGVFAIQTPNPEEVSLIGSVWKKLRDNYEHTGWSKKPDSESPATDSASNPKATVKRIQWPGFRTTDTEQRELKPGAEVLIDQRTKLKREKLKIDGEIRTMEARRAAIDAQLLALKIDLNSNY